MVFVPQPRLWAADHVEEGVGDHRGRNGALDGSLSPLRMDSAGFRTSRAFIR